MLSNYVAKKLENLNELNSFSSLFPRVCSRFVLSSIFVGNLFSFLRSAIIKSRRNTCVRKIMSYRSTNYRHSRFSLKYPSPHFIKEYPFEQFYLPNWHTGYLFLFTNHDYIFKPTNPQEVFCAESRRTNTVNFLCTFLYNVSPDLS